MQKDKMYLNKILIYTSKIRRHKIVNIYTDLNSQAFAISPYPHSNICIIYTLCDSKKKKVCRPSEFS